MRISAGDSRTTRGSPRSLPTLPGTCRCGCSPGCTTSCSANLATWDEVGAALDDHAEFLARWSTEQDVQTNEVQRAWGLLPAFLSVADARPFDLLELGPSAGLNLLWDRYSYRYSTGRWGQRAVRADRRRSAAAAGRALLERRVSVAAGAGDRPEPGRRDDRSRLAPAAGLRLARPAGTARAATARDRRRAPRPAGAAARRLRRGAAGAAAGPARRRAARGLPVRLDPVPDVEALQRLRARWRAAGREEPLVFITTGRAPDDTGYALEVERHPDGQARRVGVLDFHGEWLEWGR